MSLYILNSGQTSCHNTQGAPIACHGSGQDAEFQVGKPWPQPRFVVQGQQVLDRLTGLCWLQQANLAEFPLTWVEALAFIDTLNQGNYANSHDWRLPNRRELRSLISYQTAKPALPSAHPFDDVFQSWYWSCSSAHIQPAFAWYVHMAGGRMFYGDKQHSYMVWPVRGSSCLPKTGQLEAYDAQGQRIPNVAFSEQGVHWPEKRFVMISEQSVLDQLTQLIWSRCANNAAGVTTWAEALEVIAQMNRNQFDGRATWRLPTINELESLVDCGQHAPALPQEHPFEAVQPIYWSSTTSLYEPDWAWALYLQSGACGVGQKKDPHFAVWAVSIAL